jgi:hypothetical protein
MTAEDDAVHAERITRPNQRAKVPGVPWPVDHDDQEVRTDADTLETVIRHPDNGEEFRGLVLATQGPEEIRRDLVSLCGWRARQNVLCPARSRRATFVYERVELPTIRKGHVDWLNTLDEERSRSVPLLAIRRQSFENLIRAVSFADQKRSWSHW